MVIINNRQWLLDYADILQDRPLSLLFRRVLADAAIYDGQPKHQRHPLRRAGEEQLPSKDWPPMLSECQCLPYSSGHFLFQSVERTMRRSVGPTSEKYRKSGEERIYRTKGANDAAVGPIILLWTAIDCADRICYRQLLVKCTNCQLHRHLRTCRYALGKR